VGTVLHTKLLVIIRNHTAWQLIPVKTQSPSNDIFSFLFFLMIMKRESGEERRGEERIENTKDVSAL
jgi:hypothetical protein